jgi:hypothetical protein
MTSCADATVLKRGSTVASTRSTAMELCQSLTLTGLRRFGSRAFVNVPKPLRGKA